MSNYAKKIWFKSATGLDRSRFSKKPDLASLKATVDKSNVDELQNVQSGLISLKSKLDRSYVDKLATVPVDLKKIK